MKIICVHNMKGGVGKTTAAVNLAHLASREGKTLLWDLDGQGSASYILRTRTSEAAGLTGFLKKKKLKGRHKIIETDYPGLYLFPSHPSNRLFEFRLHRFKHGRKSLSRVAREMGESFDYVFVDLPPGLHRTHEGILRAADLILVPLVPDSMGVHALEQLAGETRGLFKGDASPFRIFYSMAIPNRKSQKEIMENPSLLPYPVLETFIPQSSLADRMADKRRTLVDLSETKEPVPSFKKLWIEIQRTLDGRSGSDEGE